MEERWWTERERKWEGVENSGIREMVITFKFLRVYSLIKLIFYADIDSLVFSRLHLNFIRTVHQNMFR